MCSAEPVSQAKRDKIERSWGAKLTDNFGMTEAGMMGSEWKEDEPGLGFRIWSDLYFIEVLDPKSLEPAKEGEVGTLVVTALQTNNVTPFLRWSSGDLVTYSEAEKGSRTRSRCSRASSTRTAPPASSRSAASTSATRTSRTSCSATVEIGDFRAEALNEGGNDFLQALDRSAPRLRRLRDLRTAHGLADEAEVRARRRRSRCSRPAPWPRSSKRTSRPRGSWTAAADAPSGGVCTAASTAAGRLWA